jgi:DNA-binding response OmpR family regulator
MPDSRLRILLVEDNKGDALLVEEYLREVGQDAFQLRRAETLAQGRALLDAFRPQVILLDLNLPDSKGLATLVALCVPVESGRPQPPIVVLTSLDDTEMAGQALSHCAQDYLVKNDVTPARLVRAIRYAIARHGGREVDRMLTDPDKSDGNSKEAMEVLQRVNRTAPGEVAVDHLGLLHDDDATAGGTLFLEHFAAGSKATEVVLTGLDQRLRRLEEGRHAGEIRDARRETLLTQLERLVLGNGRGALAARLESIEKMLVVHEDERLNYHKVLVRLRVTLALLVLAALAMGGTVAWNVWRLSG